MITYDIFLKNIKNNKIGNSYVFCGADEELIKESINSFTKKYTNDEMSNLNFVKFDGSDVTFDIIKNASETVPFFSDKKLILVKRANFIKDKTDSAGTKLYNELKGYLKDIPEFTTLIMYFVFDDKRDTPNKNRKIMSIDKLTTVVHVDKLKRDTFIKKVEGIFNKKNKEIGKVELSYFCDIVPNNFEVIENEIEKLIGYTYGREIKREDIDALIPRKNEDDIFDLVDFVSQKKIERAIDVLNDMLFKSDSHMLIVISLENQFKRLLRIKIEIENGGNIDKIVSALKVPPFVAQKLVNLSRKFTKRQVEELLKITVRTEGKLKTSNTSKKTELELLLINTLLVKA